ncbi:hypothetical protein B7463_g2427, partial [Scytalidium lignicola]
MNDDLGPQRRQQLQDPKSPEITRFGSRHVSTDSQLTGASATTTVSGRHRQSTTDSSFSSNTENSSDIIIEEPEGEEKRHIPRKRRTRSCSGRTTKDFFLTGLAERPYIYENVLLSPDAIDEEWMPDLSRVSFSDDGSSLRRWSTDDDGWDGNALLEITNDARASLKKGTLSLKTTETLKNLLAAIIIEDSGSRAMDFDIILKSHFDKLLEDLINALRSRSGPTWDAFIKLVQEAETLQHKWLHRYRLQYTLIDDARMRLLQEEDGPLHDMALTCDRKKGGQQWLINKSCGCQNLDPEHNEENCYQPGLWWPNMACAQRDKIVSTSNETISKGQYDLIALPMLTGSEEEGNEPGTRRFLRTGSMGDMHIGLMQKVGHTIRVLRGHTLKSKFAPRVGIRYDGLYILKRYGQTRDEGTNTCHLDITFERVKDQTSMGELMRIPLPSQRDDWRQYKRMLGEDIRSREGEIAFNQWKIVQEAEKKETADWHKDSDFQDVVKDSAQEIICR